MRARARARARADSSISLFLAKPVQSVGATAYYSHTPRRPLGRRVGAKSLITFREW